MFNEAYEPQCRLAKAHCTDARQLKRRRLTLLALALGTFCIGTSEFASMGMLQLFAASLGLDLSTATHAVEAYALGVVLGGPAVTILAAKLNRKSLLLALMAVFVLGNVLSAVATGLGSFTLARFVSGIPQGAYFGAGAVVASYIVGPGQGGRAFALVMTGLTVATIVGSPLATLLGQSLGWRNAYLAVSALGVLSFIALWLCVPRSAALDGGPVLQELRALNRASVWAMVAVAALGVASIFAVYTFIGPLVTDGAGLSATWIPIALGLFGIGMTMGNVIGGWLADRHPSQGLVAGFGSALVALALLAVGGRTTWVLMVGLLAVGATMMVAIPTIQVRLTRAAPDAPTLMGAMNLAALNVANAIGAWAGGQAIAQGYGLLSAAWAGFALTLAGLALFLLVSRKPLDGRRARELSPL
ncbi:MULTISPECIES: MFS transporter [unclassified Rhizobacter]|uniref:MFS transporter n=1 Tax=unclassified Rhizobacter TaxID=2640088 RepID=UPI0006FD2464|nr:MULTISPECIES: MFS transporter [unclassified Rhizobacter]KQU80393.1 permease [Rhizobacter sp. Root29]KQW13891.1 permease [Rhizobacter sp. Root1238]KRB15715.1 permease [Rhizobacter sp. Root16D2]